MKSLTRRQRFARLALTAILGCAIATGSVCAAEVAGTITDATTSAPIGFATIRVLGTGRSMLANEAGQFRLLLDSGDYRLKFSHVAHYSRTIELHTEDSAVHLDVQLQPSLIELPGTKVYDRAYDPAQRIILEAIARKSDLLSRTKNYEFDAYTRLVVRNRNKDDSSDIMIITETQLTGYWSQPDRYKEIITARKQSSNMDADENLVSVGEILNFNRNRLDIGRYSIVSPTATDALNHYNYYLLDTIVIDNARVFRLEIEPKSQVDALFKGTIDIADSSFAVIGVDVALNRGFESSFMSDIRYHQRFAHFDNQIEMPTEIRATGQIDLPLPGLPHMTFDYVAVLSEYRFDVEPDNDLFDEYVLEVDEAADDADSAMWFAGPTIPLTELEQRGYERIDSVENAPKPLPARVLRGTAGLLFLFSNNRDFFHFNRVEGFYLGVGHFFRDLLPRTDLYLSGGYAIDEELWQQEIRVSHMLHDRHKLKLDLAYKDRIVHRPTVMSSLGAVSTLGALSDKIDPFDYYREKGFRIDLSTKLRPHLYFRSTYSDYEQTSVANNTEYSLFSKSKEHRLNPAIEDGKLRSLSGHVTYDSRPLLRNKGRDEKLFELPFMLVRAGLEVSAPDLFNSGFDYRRYYLWLYRIQPVPGLGLISLYSYAGGSDKALPPQKYFTVDFKSDFTEGPITFHTLDESNFSGSRVVALYAEHDFRRILTRKTGLPLVRNFPFGLLLHGGIFWTDFAGLADDRYSRQLSHAEDPYSETGFGFSHLPLLDMSLRFTWQLSDYNTSRFSFSLSTPFN